MSKCMNDKGAEKWQENAEKKWWKFVIKNKNTQQVPKMFKKCEKYIKTCKKVENGMKIMQKKRLRNAEKMHSNFKTYREKGQKNYKLQENSE